MGVTGHLRYGGCMLVDAETNPSLPGNKRDVQ